MNAFVTGAGGFLGLYVVEQLTARGDRVRALCRGTSPQLDALGMETVRADLRDPEAVSTACRGMDAVFHIGGIAGIGGLWKDYFENNTLGTRHVVEGCLAHGVKQAGLYQQPERHLRRQQTKRASTNRRRIPSDGFATIRTRRPWPSNTCLASNGQSGLLTCALRPHLIWGPRDRYLVPRLLADARSGRLRRIGDGTNLIDTVYVENAAAAHCWPPTPCGPAPRGGPGVFHQPRRAGELLGVDQQHSRLGRFAAGAKVDFRADRMDRRRGMRICVSRCCGCAANRR